MHENEIPDLDVAVAVLLGSARRATFYLGPVVIEDLRARPARTRVTHRPEIVLLSAPSYPFGGNTALVAPDSLRFVVIFEYRDPQLLARQPIAFGEEFPRLVDSLAFKVVAEAEVTEHLEERVVPCGVSDVLKIIVLSTGAHAALRGHCAGVRALLRAGKHVLELNHARIGKQQRRIIARYQRTARNDLVALLLEVVKKLGANLIAGDHGNPYIFGAQGTGAALPGGKRFSVAGSSVGGTQRRADLGVRESTTGEEPHLLRCLLRPKGPFFTKAPPPRCFRPDRPDLVAPGQMFGDHRICDPAAR